RILSVLLFFFSSRRRHTRCYRDWSSDVCSSDLPSIGVALTLVDPNGLTAVKATSKHAADPLASNDFPGRTDKGITLHSTSADVRSEERRVGKECSSRRSPGHDKKTTIEERRTDV